MKPNKIFLLLTMIIIPFCISGCGLSPKEQERLEEYTSLAESYYEEKYNTDIEIIENAVTEEEKTEAAIITLYFIKLTKTLFPIPNKPKKSIKKYRILCYRN